jgi:hypothetical protein
MSDPEVAPALQVEGVAEPAAATRKLTPEEHWEWFEPHVRHWHGFWVVWTPVDGKQIQRSFLSVRSFSYEDEAKTRVVQWNDRFEDVGDQKLHMDKGPWYITREEHSGPDGLSHPQNTSHKVLYLPNGDCVWVQPRLLPDNPKSVVFVEFFFMHGEGGRFSVPVGFDAGKKLNVALLLEDAMATAERPDASWHGTSLSHSRADLEEARPEPEGTFVGKEFANNMSLEFSEHDSALYAGFTSGVPEGEKESYLLSHLPHGLTVAAPREAPIGKEFLFVVTWHVSSKEVRQLRVKYLASGELDHFAGGYYSSP